MVWASPVGPIISVVQSGVELSAGCLIQQDTGSCTLVLAVPCQLGWMSPVAVSLTGHV